MTEAICKGSYVFGTACDKCSRCVAERKHLTNIGMPVNNHQAALDVAKQRAKQPRDTLTLRRVANGWVILPGPHVSMNEFTHVAATPGDLAKHVELWAEAQG